MARYTLVIGNVTDEQIGKLRDILARKTRVQDKLYGPIVRISHAQARQMADFFSETHVPTKDVGFDLLRRLVLSCTRQDISFQEFNVVYDEQAWAVLRNHDETFNGGELSIFSIFCTSEFLIREGKFHQRGPGKDRGCGVRMRLL